MGYDHNKPISIDESKELQIELLKTIHEICEKYGLTYYMMFGSLIGAVRHHGFIPWDDDIDICMPRKDYAKFFELLNQEQAHGMRAVCCENEDKYYLPFGKVINTLTILKENVSCSYELGIYVDVFPLDLLSSDKKLNQRLKRRILVLRRLLAIKLNPGSDKRKGLRKILHYVLNHTVTQINMNKISTRINTLSQMAEIDDATMCGILSNTDERGIQREYKCDWFSGKQLMEFEGLNIWVPSGYVEILRYIYGDYVILPPEETRRSAHEYSMWWK